MVNEMTKIIVKPNHGRVYHLSYRATQQYINAILNPFTGNMMEYRHLISDPETREVWEKSSANEFGRPMKVLKGESRAQRPCNSSRSMRSRTTINSPTHDSYVITGHKNKRRK